MTIPEFIAKWSKANLSERSASQQHFLDLCEVLEHPKPAAMDPTGETFTFEKGAAKLGGGDGWADVWKKGFFGWEYKGKHRDLDAAYQQLQKYQVSLENPPLLVVSDMDTIIVRTNFTNTPQRRHDIPLSSLNTSHSLDILRWVFFEPERLRPDITRDAITTLAAQRFANIAQTLRARNLDAHDVAIFLDRIIFCLFAEDVGLLPSGLFSRLVNQTATDPERFARYLGQLFQAMATGGDFLMEDIRHFNGNLFSDAHVIDLREGEIALVDAAARLDWGAVDPSVFGTLFERGMDPAKRSQLGAHYTSRDDIETLVEPVVMQPLRREWEAARSAVENLLTSGQKGDAPARTLSADELQKARSEAESILRQFHHRLAAVKVLDPACGSGNFLYVSLQKLMDLERKVLDLAFACNLEGFMQLVGPWQLYGIEISPYAYDLAQMTVWIGYLQWRREHGDPITESPVLKSSDNFRLMDAILDLSDPENPKEPEWPAVDFIVGNPPFLGDKLMRRELGDEYVDKLRAFYKGRIPGQSDLCCYWFEKARAQIEQGKCRRAGLLATQGIRGGANREVLKRTKETGDIFFAESDRPWVLDGANVHVSMVGFDDGGEQSRALDGLAVGAIYANLTTSTAAAADLTQAVVLSSNAGEAFLGSCKGGPFDVREAEALAMLAECGNPHNRPNSDVIRPVFNSRDLLQRSPNRWIVDTAAMELMTASHYEQPFTVIAERVLPLRAANRDAWLRTNWWRPQRMRPEMRHAAFVLDRFAVTTTTSKHRLFVWLAPPQLPDHQLIVFARSDDYFLGVLHSRVHELWALRLGTRLETRPRYTPTTCFETFPFPQPTPAQEAAIAEAAKELDTLRSNWLNPPEWTREEVLEFPGSVDGPWARYVHDPDARGIGTVRWPRIVARPGDYGAMLAKRTLTNLYNARPTWLDLAHRKLDAAVFAAYAWDAGISDDELLEKLLALNLERAGADG